MDRAEELVAALRAAITKELAADRARSAADEVAEQARKDHRQAVTERQTMESLLLAHLFEEAEGE